MPRDYLLTSDLAAAVGVHPNTVRLYEEWGFLPPIPRAPNGYRKFTPAHLEQMRLARMAMHGTWPGRRIRKSALKLVRKAASGDLGGALELAYHHLALVQAERARAEAAARLLERWAKGAPVDDAPTPLQIGEAARLLDVSTDQLRNWERNGLIEVPRNPRNNYRLYGTAELGRLRVIRMLLRAGYSMMAVLRMLLQLDRNHQIDVRRALNTPRADEDAYTATDRWLSSLAAVEQRAEDIITQVERMIGRQR